MKKIDSKNIDTIINKMKSMLNEKELGVKVSFGGARYDSDSFRVNLEVSLPNAKTKEEKALEHEIKVVKRKRNAAKQNGQQFDAMIDNMLKIEPGLEVEPGALEASAALQEELDATIVEGSKVPHDDDNDDDDDGKKLDDSEQLDDHDPNDHLARIVAFP